CVRRRTAVRRTCRASLPRGPPPQRPNPFPHLAIALRCTRCAHRSSRAAPARGRQRGAVAATWSAQSANPGPRLYALGSSRAVEYTVALGQFDVGQMLLVVAGEHRGALHVHGDEVQPVTRLRPLGGGQRLLTRRADRSLRQALVEVRVPWGVAAAVDVGGRDLLPVQRVVDGGVEFELLVNLQPVVDD